MGFPRAALSSLLIESAAPFSAPSTYASGHSSGFAVVRLRSLQSPAFAAFFRICHFHPRINGGEFRFTLYIYAECSFDAPPHSHPKYPGGYRRSDAYDYPNNIGSTVHDRNILVEGRAVPPLSRKLLTSSYS
jgi:hypothetical protein